MNAKSNWTRTSLESNNNVEVHWARAVGELSIYREVILVLFSFTRPGERSLLSITVASPAWARAFRTLP